MSFQASDREFRARFWIIGLIFGTGFSLYFVDGWGAADALARAILGIGRDESSEAFLPTVQALFAAGTLLAILAGLVRSWATSYLVASIVHDAGLHSERLVADGPYRHVRNPLYLGNILLASGMGLLASRAGYVFIVVATVVFAYRLILHEEAALLASQGESYRRYLDAVPRLLPALAPRVPPGGRVPNWKDGFVGEAFIWIFTAGLAVFTVTLDQTYFFLALGAGFAVYFAQGWLRKKPDATEPRAEA